MGNNVKRGSHCEKYRSHGKKNWLHFEMCSKFHSVTHFSQRNLFFPVWPIFMQWDPFFICGSWKNWVTMGRMVHTVKKDQTLKNGSHFGMCSKFHSLNQIYKCDPILAVWPISFRVTNVLKCVISMFYSVTRWSKCDQFFIVWHIFFKCDPFSQCDKFFQLWTIFHSVAHFSKCDQFFTL